MSTVRLTQAESGQVISLQVGDEIVLELAENPTTGYQWDIEPVGKGVLRSAPADYRAPTGLSPGVGGLRQFLFNVAAPGETALRLKHWRDWEGDNSVIARFQVTLQVRPAPNRNNDSQRG